MFNPFSKIPSLNCEDVAKRINGEENVTFIDVRSETEYAEGHAEGARNVPLATLMSRTEKLVPYDEVYVICRSGGRSGQAVQYLVTNGVHAVNVTGGMNAWKNAGLPMTA